MLGGGSLENIFPRNIISLFQIIQYKFTINRKLLHSNFRYDTEIFMINKMNIDIKKQTFGIYIFLVVITLAAYRQVHQFEFINFDDIVYVTQNHYVQSGLTFDGIRWAFSTLHAEFWHPLTWLSLMIDYQIYGSNAGGFHVTNLIFHILSTLLLFWLFHRMTGAVWKSAFVAALFAIHPLHVESVAWVSERKDVLSVFFWMLTLCFYIYYSEKTDFKRYLLVFISFLFALLSKPMVVTLPVIMILLDYWPLRRFNLHKHNVILWQCKEKAPFIILSAIFTIISVCAQYYNIVDFQYPLSSLYINSLYSFVTYLEKTFWPYNLSVYYDFLYQMPMWQIIFYCLLIVFISISSVIYAKRYPGLFVGWLWYAITILPVIGILPRGFNNLADHFTYLPLTGIFMMIAWGTPILIKNQLIKNYFIIPAAILFIFISAFLSWQQVGYWRKSIDLARHSLKVTQNNYMAHNNIGPDLAKEGKIEEAIYHYNEAIRLNPFYADAYNNRGVVYVEMGQYKKALEDFNKSIQCYANAINNKNKVSFSIGPSEEVISVRINSLLAGAYNNRGITYFNLGDYMNAINDFNISIRLKDDNFKAYYNRGRSFSKINKFQNAIDDYDKSISLQPKNSEAYISRGVIHFKISNDENGCYDARKACELGNCKLLRKAKDSQACH